MAVEEQELRPDLVVHSHGDNIPHEHGVQDLTELSINTIRTLAIDAVEAAGSGHPGTPMALAPLGYDLPLTELRRFRQLGSRCPGHPERGVTAGVEVTTGPLGQGFANAVGLAVAERLLAGRFNRAGHDIVDHHTYVICSDGDLMEGVSAEAASLAGNLPLGKLIVFYDDNHITIEGSTELAFCEQVEKRFEAYGWHVVSAPDVNDLDGLAGAIVAARSETGRPSLVMVRSVIGYGAPTKSGTAAAHGAPLGADETRAVKANLDWPYPEPFTVPDEVRRLYHDAVLMPGRGMHARWRERFAAYGAEYSERAAELQRTCSGVLPGDWERSLPSFPADGDMATRAASGRALNALAGAIAEIVGGSADLTPSTDTYLEGFGDVSCRDFGGRNFHFGVREHAMGSVLNGLAAHGGLRPFGATFLVFSDYMRPPVRLAALMGLPVVFVFTHDSIGVREDGPTHQPVEHLVGLRSVPDLVVLRPADANETAAAWQIAVDRRHGPTALALTRQKVPILPPPPPGAVAQGAYVRVDGDDFVLVASGSEVHVALAARARLAASGISARVVSMPSWELFEAQPVDYQQAVLPADRFTLAVEAGRSLGWCAWADTMVSVDRFGASAPTGQLFEAFGITPDQIVAQVHAVLAR
jgi:transketolase